MIMLKTSSAATPVIAPPISPDLIAAMFKCLALVPKRDRHDPALVIAIARTIARSEREAVALFIRIRAASFRATGITTYQKNGGTLEKAANMASHASTRSTPLYDRHPDDVTLDEIEKIQI